MTQAIQFPAKKARKRVGRGNGSNKGTYCGRGCKGQNARSGGGVRLGFEGGQTALLQRMPKLRGFKNINRMEYVAVNLDVIEERYADGEVVSKETLIEKGIISKTEEPKILGRGTLTKKVTFENVEMSKKLAESMSKKKPAKAAAKKEEKTEV